MQHNCLHMLYFIAEIMIASLQHPITSGGTDMDTRKNFIIKKGKYDPSETADVVYCENSVEAGKWRVKYKSGKEYNCPKNNFLWLKSPVSVDPDKVQVKHAGTYITHIREIYVFKHENTEYWHIIKENGNKLSYNIDEIEIEDSIMDNPEVQKLHNYFHDIANIVTLRDEETDKKILVDKLKQVNFIGSGTAAAVYLGVEEYTSHTDLDATAPIFPFGCNESQFQAVINALSNRLSVIEGPPGTGKTQTILNIVANLVLQGKTVQIVSNNNSAIMNVQEKLASDKYGFGFIMALLGNKKNKEAFLAGQELFYPDLSSWMLQEDEGIVDDLLKDVQKRSGRLQEIFRDKNNLATLKQDLIHIQKEKEHFSTVYPDNRTVYFKKPVDLVLLSKIRNVFTDFHELDRKPGLWFRVFNRFYYGVRMGRMMKAETAAVTECLDTLFYELKIEELKEKIRLLEEKLEAIDADKEIQIFTELSLKVFRAKLAERYGSLYVRQTFDDKNYYNEYEAFLSEYPVVLSTTYCARSNIRGPFDYVILDEASQSDIITGMISMSSARNAVIVGDTKQLPNVVSEQEAVQKIIDEYDVPEVYDFNKYCFLKSILVLLGDEIPSVTLREHYRCHPLIIGFCNQKFYDNQLIVMTENTDIESLKLVETVPGKHDRGNRNQRQIDVITEEILPSIHCDSSEVGIITPYKDQKNKINQEIKRKCPSEKYEASTIHKFQGREMDTIIFSTTDDVVWPFSDGSEILNVAISRAKNHLIIVASDKEQPSGSNMADLIGYIKYHNPNVKKSEIRSVFDYLYKEYEQEREEYLKKTQLVSSYASENLMYDLIRKELDKREDVSLDVLVHHPLVYLITDRSALNEDEIRFIDTGLSHIDFLIYNTLTKQPVLAVEVDGVSYHKEGTKQAERDRMKDHILEVSHIPYKRFSTNGSNENRLLQQELDTFFALL